MKEEFSKLEKQSLKRKLTFQLIAMSTKSWLYYYIKSCVYNFDYTIIQEICEHVENLLLILLGTHSDEKHKKKEPEVLQVAGEMGWQQVYCLHLFEAYAFFCIVRVGNTWNNITLVF